MATDESPVKVDPVSGDTSALESLGFNRLQASDLSETGEGKTYDPLRH